MNMKEYYECEGIKSNEDIYSSFNKINTLRILSSLHINIMVYSLILNITYWIPQEYSECYSLIIRNYLLLISWKI